MTWYCIGKIFILNHTPEKSLFYTRIWYFFLKDPFLPKIMKILPLKNLVKIWGLSLSQYCKRFWFSNCSGIFFILNSTSEISVYLTSIWYLFFERFTFAKIINIFLIIYWIKTWGLWRSQYCKRFWLVNCIWKILFWTVHLK